MAELGGVFDATAVEPSAGFDGEPLPVGSYLVAMTGSERKEKENGWGLNLEFTVLDGEYKGRKLWEYLNMQHPNAQTQSISHATFSAICHAVQVLKPVNTQQLHDIPLVVSAKVTPPRSVDGKDYPAGNKVTRYAAAGAVAGSVTPASPKAEKKAAPWAKKSA